MAVPEIAFDLFRAAGSFLARKTTGAYDAFAGNNGTRCPCSVFISQNSKTKTQTHLSRGISNRKSAINPFYNLAALTLQEKQYLWQHTHLRVKIQNYAAKLVLANDFADGWFMGVVPTLVIFLPRQAAMISGSDFDIGLRWDKDL
ncbi:MAG: hypothetical protein IPO26_21210 [Saprospiraceae bacterium]|nr:hypothetical protein [Saprospiraceae bacterium]